MLPVAVSGPRLIEGVGLGCEDIPEDKLLTSNVSVLIEEFITDSTRTELKFDPDLAKADRALIHVLAQKHNLGHKSSGKGKERFITVSKRARGQSSSSGQTEADIEAASVVPPPPPPCPFCPVLPQGLVQWQQLVKHRYTSFNVLKSYFLWGRYNNYTI